MSRDKTSSKNGGAMQNPKGFNRRRFNQWLAVSSIAGASGAVFGKQTVDKKTLKAREENIMAAFKSAGVIYAELNNLEKNGIIALTGTLEMGLIKAKDHMAHVVGEGGIFDQRIPGLTKKIKASNNAVKELNALAKQLNKVPELVSVLGIGSKFSSGEDIKVEIGKTEISLQVRVNLDAKKFVREIVDVKFDRKRGLGKDQLMTHKQYRKAEKGDN